MIDERRTIVTSHGVHVQLIVLGFASRLFFLQSIYKGHDCKSNCSEGWQIHEHRDRTNLFHYSDEKQRGRFEM